MLHRSPRTLKRWSRLALQAGFVCSALFAGVGWVSSSSSSPPAGYTGSPLDGQNCTACHLGSPVSNSASLSLSGLPAQWVPATPYALTLTLGAGTRYGFEFTAENGGGKRGTFAAGPNSTVLDGGQRYLGHSGANTSVNSWTFTWTAPASGAGSISFYLVGNAANNSGTNSGDAIHLKNYTVAEQTLPPPALSSLSPAFGSAAEPVVLGGSGFVGLTSTVSFGGVNAACSSGGDTSLSCSVPAGAPAGNISVTVTNASGASNARVFYSITGAPSVSAVSPAYGSSTDTARGASLTGANISKSASLRLTKAAQADINATDLVAASSAALSAALFDLSGAATGQWNVVVANPDGQSGTLANGYSVLTLPAAPGGLAGTATSTGSIRWQWTDNSDNEDGFRLLTSTGGAVSGVLPAGSVLYDETGLQGNFPAARIIQVFNLVGSSDSLTASTYTLTAAPAAPLAPAVTSGTVIFSWQQSNAAGTTYIAEIATGSFSSAPPLASSQTASGSASFGSLAANAVYFLRVKARGYDNSETAYTAEISTPTGAAPPSGTTLVGVSSDTAVLTWSGNGNPAGTIYQVQVSTAAGFGSVLASSATLASTAAVSGLLPNTTHYLRVRAFNLAGVPSDFDAASPSTVTLAAVPGTPSVVVRDTSSLTIQWAAGLNPPDTLYTLELSTNNFGPVLASSQTKASQAVISGLAPSTTYYFRAAAADRIGRATAFSPVASTKTASVVLTAPLGVSGTALGVSSVTWSWNPVAGATSYDLYSASATSPGAYFAAGFAGTEYIQSGLAANTSYTVRIAAADIEAVEGPLSVAAAVYTAAEAPAGTQALVLSSAGVRVQWTTGAAAAYAVERSTSSGGGYALAASSAAVGGAAQYIDTGLSPSTTYFYRVRAYNGGGVPTAYDAEASTLTYPAPPGIPALSGHAVSTGSIQWSWTVSGGAPASFLLWASTGGEVAALPGSATQYLEAGLSSATAFGRYLEALNISGSVFSSTATAASADAFVAVTAASSATLSGTDGLTRLELAASALPASGQAAVSDDPLNRPLAAGTPELIAGANAALPAGLEGPASSVREFLVVINGQRYTGTFASAVTVRLPYPDANADGFVDGVSPPLRAGSLSLYTLNEQLGTWEAVPGSAVDQAAGTVTGAVAHLSVFGLFGSPASSDLSSLKVFPNPWRPGSGGPYDAAGVRFQNLTGGAVIRIFTISGEPVRRLEKTPADGNEKLWDGANDGGRKTASGVYLYQVKSSGGQKRTGRIAIIR